MESLAHDFISSESSADLGFSRKGERTFTKNFANFVDLFTGRPNWFSEFSQSFKTTLFWTNFDQKAVWGIFSKCLPKNRVFSARASLLKLVYIGAGGAFRKFKGSFTKNWYLKIVQKDTLWVGKGSNPWGGGTKYLKKNPFFFKKTFHSKKNAP